MAIFHFHKLRIIIPLLGIFSCFSMFYLNFYKTGVKHIKNYINVQAAHLACIQPSTKEEMIDLENFISNKDVLVCDGAEEDWVTVNRYEAEISKHAVKLHGKITCSYKELIRVDDNNTKEGKTFTTSNIFIFSSSDFYSVSCVAENGKRWESTLVGIRKDDVLRLDKGWDMLPNGAVKLNVLMLAFDSLSHSSFVRTLPKTNRFLKKELKANILDGYNIIGDGTPQALIPMLTGKTEFELPETRKRMGEKAEFVNVYPFIWKDFERNGFVTLFAEDQPEEGCFNYRLKGFDAPPTNHYMRPFYTYMYPSYHKHPNYCFYSTPRHKVFLKYLTAFFEAYEDKPKFAFGMHAELSHNDHNLIGIADEDIEQSLSHLRSRGYLNDTVLMMFSDHGNRFSAMRATQQGKQEERLPFFSIYLPPKFKELYPSAADNVRVNSGRLSTPFDIYATLKDLTKFSGAKLGKLSERGLSLFSEIPPSRTCSDAFIEPHWCACLTWDPIPVANDKVTEAGNALIHYINSYTAPQRGLCHELKMLTISSAALLLPNEGVLSFKQTADYDGFLPEFSDQTTITEEVYQVTIAAVPTKDYFYTSNDLPMFEASLTYNTKQDSFSVKIDDISRINKYGDQPHCVRKHHPHLRKFCYCLLPP